MRHSAVVLWKYKLTHKKIFLQENNFISIGTFEKENRKNMYTALPLTQFHYLCLFLLLTYSIVLIYYYNQLSLLNWSTLWEPALDSNWIRQCIDLLSTVPPLTFYWFNSVSGSTDSKVASLSSNSKQPGCVCKVKLWIRDIFGSAFEHLYVYHTINLFSCHCRSLYVF